MRHFLEMFLFDMNPTTCVSATIASLMIVTLLATAPAIRADEKQKSIRDPLEFERFAPREKLTEADLKRLEPMWKILCERSNELKSISESLVKSGWSNERINELLISVFEGHAAQLSAGRSRQMGLALTVPSLEPTYPVPGGQSPAYLLPAMAKHEGRRWSSGTHIGAGAGYASAMLRLGPERKIHRVLDDLCLIYQGYKSRCSVLKKFDIDAQYQGSGKTPQLERRRALISDRDNLRKQLVELVGEDAVKKLDDELHELESNKLKPPVD